MDINDKSRDIDITKHAEKRVRQRIGLPKKSVESHIELVFEYGLQSKDFSGSFKRYLDKFYFSRGSANKAILYNGFIYLCKGDVLITVIKCPNKFKDVEPKLNKNDI